MPWFRYRTGSCIGIFVHIPVPGLPDAGQSGISAIRKLYESVKGYTMHARANCRWWKGIHTARARPYTAAAGGVLDIWFWKIIGMLEKVSRHRHFAVSQLPQSGIGNPAAGSVRYRWSQVSPAFPCYGWPLTPYLSLLTGDTYSQSCFYFRPALGTIAPLTFSLVSSHPPPPLPWVNKYTVYAYTVCKGGGGLWGHLRGGGLRQIKQLPQSHFTGQIF